MIELIIIDLEATCWEGDPPFGEQSEIIEFGICRYRQFDDLIEAPISIIVKPVNSMVSKFCMQLTTLTQKKVDRGVSLEAACKVLEVQYDARSHVWASYGAYDRNMLERQCGIFGVPYPMSDWHINLKQQLADFNYTKPVGMAKALSSIGETLEGTHHRGVDDAYNIAKIARYLSRNGALNVPSNYKRGIGKT